MVELRPCSPSRTELQTYLNQWLWVFLTLTSYYRRHPGQALAMGLGIVSGVALWAAVQLINDHARSSYSEADQLLGAEAHYWIRDRAGLDVNVAAYISLRRAGFDAIYPVIEAQVRTQQGGSVTLIATDLLALPALDRQGEKPVYLDPMGTTRWLSLIQPDYQAWYSESLARQLGVETGQRLMLASGKSLPPAVIQTQARQGQRIFMDLAAAMALLETETLSYLAVGSLSESKQAYLKEQLPVNLMLETNHQALDLEQVTASLHTHLTALGLLSFAVGLFIVFNAVRFSLLARQSTLTILREMGVSLSILTSAIIAESLVWALLGTSLGLILGHVLSQLLLPAMTISLQSLYAAELGASIAISGNQVWLAFGLSLAGMALALTLPLWFRATESIRQQREVSAQGQRDRRSIHWMALVAVAMLAISILLYSRFDSVEQGFFILALVMFGGGLLLPWILLSVIEVIAGGLPHRRWLLRWAVSDSLAQLPHLRIALMALLLTLTANIGVTSLVGSFRTALSTWLETRLAADIYVQSDALDSRLSDSGLVARSQWLKAYSPRLGLDLRWQNRATSIRGLALNAPDTLAMVLAQAQDGGVQAWRNGSGPVTPILANEQVRYLAQTPLNSIVTLPTPSGSQQFQIVGFLHDYGNANLAFYLPQDSVRTLWPAAKLLGAGLWLAESDEIGDPALLSSRLSRLGIMPGQWAVQADIKRLSFAIFDRTFAITATLNILTLLVAGLSLLTALLAVHQQRAPEYARWRAMGLNYSQWLKIVAAPLVLMVSITLLVSLPLGFSLSWLLINKLNVIAFGWTMPLLWSWWPLAKLATMTLGIVLATLCVAVFRVRQTLPTAIQQNSREAG